MALIRPVRPDELDSFTDLADATADRNAAARESVQDLFAKRCSRPEWCFLAEEDGRTVASVLLWSPPGRDVPMDLVMLEAAPGETGLALIAHAAEYAAAHGATQQGYALDYPAAPSQHHGSVSGRDELLTAAGFHLARDGMRFRWTNDGDLPSEPMGLRWVSLPEAGRDAFVDLMEQVVTDTKDGWINAEIAEHGIRRAGEIMFEGTEQMDHDPAWFEIGYDPDGVAAAISMPARNPSVAVLGFVGVAHTHRGRGYASAVVARGTRILAQSGADEIRGDCDKDNPGIVKAFLRNGYDNFTNRRDYTRTL